MPQGYMYLNATSMDQSNKAELSLKYDGRPFSLISSCVFAGTRTACDMVMDPSRERTRDECHGVIAQLLDCGMTEMESFVASVEG